MKNILTGIDFHKNTVKLLDQTFELAKATGSKVWLVHVAAPDPDFVGYQPGPQVVREDRARELSDERKLLDEYTDKMKEQGVDAEGLLIPGATAKTLLKKTKELDINLMILGKHDHGPLYEAFYGSAASKIPGKADIPVLLVPMDDD